MELPSSLYYLASASLAFVLYRYFTRKSTNGQLPPGPPGLPFIGNLFDILNDDNITETFSEWGRRYNSDVVSYTVFGHTTVVLNSAKSVQEIMEKRSVNTSSRPAFFFVNEMMGWKWDIAHQPYSDWWRAHRRVFHQYFNPLALPNYYELHYRAAVNVMAKVQNSPEDHHEEYRFEVARTVMKVVFGYDVVTHDPMVEAADKAMFYLAGGMMPGILADYFPLLKYYPSWLPGSKFKDNAKIGKEVAMELREKPYANARKEINEDRAPPSMVADALTRYEGFYGKEGDVAEIVKSNSATAFIAATDTTVSFLHFWTFAMIQHPEIQKKAQEELDSVVGTDRFAEFKDREHLPYLNACIKEVLRWLPVTPTGGTPHANVEDEFYNGYVIPAGTTLVGNVYEIMKDPAVYPNPTKFDPERFLGPIEKQQADPNLYAFGFGRRICPGRYFAMDSGWAVITHMLATYTVKPALDKNGKEMMPGREATSSAVSFPAPYKVRFIPRSQDALKMVHDRLEELEQHVNYTVGGATHDRE